MQFAIKIIVSAFIVATVSELSKRNSFWAAILASLPLTSILAMLWLYRETHDANRVSHLSMGIFWLVIPSLVLFLTLPLFLKMGMSFYISLILAAALTVMSYFIMVFVLGKFGILI